jgi:hypothetical protein
VKDPLIVDCIHMDGMADLLFWTKASQSGRISSSWHG